MRLLLLCLGLQFLLGCSTLHLEIGQPIDADLAASFEPGRTRRAEVLAGLGPPLALCSHQGGVAFLYEYVDLREKQLGLGLDIVGTLLAVPQLAWFKASFGNSGSDRRAALFVFDAGGLLVDASFGSWGEVFGSGGGLQLFISVEQVVDSRSLRELPRGLSWGRELLAPLPETLNQSQRADLELRGGAHWAGQDALELGSQDRADRRD